MAGTDQEMAAQKSSDEFDSKVDGETQLNVYIGKGVKFNGTLIYDGTIRVDGTMEGELRTAGSLWVGEGAVIAAQVNAGRIISKGTITGDVVAKKSVQLRAPAALNGSITTPSLAMEAGVLFNGTVAMAAQNVSRLVAAPMPMTETEAHSSASQAL